MSEMEMTVYMPSEQGTRPAPYLMTADEVAQFLRLDGLADPEQALKRYRSCARLKPVQVGNNLRYRLPDVLRFLELCQEENPR